MSSNEILTPEAWAESVVLAWKEKGLKLCKGASHSEISQVEERLQYQFDPYFNALFLRANGFGEEDFLGYLIILWPLDQITQVYSPDFIAFGDYTINSAQYCFNKGEQGVFKLYNADWAVPEKIASSFKEFVCLFNQDDILLY